MTKYVCTVCGYIAEGSIPEFCPVCKAPASKFIEKKDNTYVTEHASASPRTFPRRSSRVCARTSTASAARSVCIWP